MNSNTLDKLKEFIRDYPIEILQFHLFLLLVVLPWIIMFGCYKKISSCFVFPLIIIFIGHFLISSFIVCLHKKAGTKDFLKDSSKNGFGIFLIQISGLLEIFFYTFLLIFHQINFIIGYLVVKSIWNYPIESKNNKDDKDNLIMKQTKANSIFRVGIILTFLVSLFAASIISGYDLTKNENFQRINKIFTVGINHSSHLSSQNDIIKKNSNEKTHYQ